MIFRLAAVFLILWMVFVPAYAEPASNPQKPWSDSAELSLVSTNGNSKSTTSSGKNTFSYKWSRTTLELIAGGLGAKSEGRVTAEEYFASEKVEFALSERDYAFEKVRWDKNRFAGIDHRYDLGGGYGRKLLATDQDKLVAEVGGGYVSEERTTGPRNDFASGRVYSKYEHIFTPTATISQDAEYLHNFDDSEDFRANTETALISALSINFSLKVGFKWKHVGKPPVGFGRNDTVTSVALIATY